MAQLYPRKIDYTISKVYVYGISLLTTSKNLQHMCILHKSIDKLA